MNSAQRKTLEAVFANPVNGNIEWTRVETLLKSLGCAVYEKGGSAVAFSLHGISVHFHRPHPQRDLRPVHDPEREYPCETAQGGR